MSLFTSRTPPKLMNSSPRIFVAEGDFFHCQKLAARLRRDHMRVVGCATKSLDIIAEAAYTEPDACLIAVDLEDGERAGLRVLLHLQAILPRMRSIIVADPSKGATVVEAFRKGANGVLFREEAVSRVAKCVRCVLAGEIWANSAQLEFVIADLRAGQRAQFLYGAPQTVSD